MKIYVLDASAIFVFLQKKRGAAKVNDLLKEAMRERAQLLMSTVNCAEVYGKIAREHGSHQAQLAMNAVRSLPISVLDATLQRCMQAADIKNQYKLYYVDSFAAAAFPDGVLFQVRQDLEHPAGTLAFAGCRLAGREIVGGVGPINTPVGKGPQRIVVVVDGQADLLEIVLALRAGGGFADLLHGRNEQTDQDGDDGDDNEQLDQREASTLIPDPGSRHRRAFQ